MKKTFETDMASEMHLKMGKQSPDLTKAAECLHSALEIFENAGLKIQANNIINLLYKIAEKAPADPHTKGLTPEKQVKNLLDHGTQFNLADDLLDADLGVDSLEVTDKEMMLTDFEDERS